MSAEPYSEEELAHIRVGGDARWLATVDALRERLTAAERVVEAARDLDAGYGTVYGYLVRRKLQDAIEALDALAKAKGA
jgi:hypothetical protein